MCSNLKKNVCAFKETQIQIDFILQAYKRNSNFQRALEQLHNLTNSFIFVFLADVVRVTVIFYRLLFWDKTTIQEARNGASFIRFLRSILHFVVVLRFFFLFLHLVFYIFYVFISCQSYYWCWICMKIWLFRDCCLQVLFGSHEAALSRDACKRTRLEKRLWAATSSWFIQCSIFEKQSCEDDPPQPSSCVCQPCKSFPKFAHFFKSALLF